MTDSLTLYKLMILFMLKNVSFPLKNSQIADFMLGKEYTSYFHLQQAISEMSESELLQVENRQNTTCYRLTESGQSTIDFFEDQIPEAIQKDVLTYLEEHSIAMRNEVLVYADYDKLPLKSEYQMHCVIKEGKGTLLELSFTVPEEAIAMQMAKSWPEKCERVYASLMELMMTEEKES